MRNTHVATAGSLARLGCYTLSSRGLSELGDDQRRARSIRASENDQWGVALPLALSRRFTGAPVNRLRSASGVAEGAGVLPVDS